MKKATHKKNNQTQPKAAIIAVGDELLQDRQDTNGPAIQKQLLDFGIETQMRMLCPDDLDYLTNQIKHATAHHAVVICCGGLGPTQDDLTRHAIAAALDKPLHFHAPTLRQISERFKFRKLSMPEINRVQAMFPKGASILKNPFGTAAGFVVPTRRGLIAAVPGPPKECLPMVESQLQPYVRKLIKGKPVVYYRRQIRVGSAAESRLQEILGPVFEADPHIQLGFLLDEPGEIFVILTLRGKDPGTARKLLAQAVRKVRQALGQHVVSTSGETLPDVVGKLLLKRKQTVALAESCTGGRVSQRIISVPGSSAYYKEGAVTYSNQAKHTRLGVGLTVLKKHGAVSRETAQAMSRGIRQKSRADWGVAVTGIAGPGGGTKNKPRGLVYISVAGPKGFHRTKQFLFPGDRERVQRLTSTATLEFLRQCLLNREMETGRPVSVGSHL